MASKPGVLSRNPGIVFGSVLTAIVAYVYRGHRNKKNFDELKDTIAETYAISPYEAFELRSNNSISYVARLLAR